MTTNFLRGLESFPPAEPGTSVVTVGTFDGIHRGHQAILRRVYEVAAETGLNPVLVTFYPHPRVVVSPGSVPMLLTSIEEKARFIPDFFDGTVLVLEFNEALMNLSAEDFVRTVLAERLGTKKLIVGYDHGLGKNRSGTIDELRRLGNEHKFEVEVVEPIMHNGDAVSSTRIRRAITKGDYAEAIDLLGHEYAISGRVERGIGLGRQIGYPTANLRYSHRKLLPPQGVYACWAWVAGKEQEGMMFIGQNHFNPETGITVEINLFDFDRDIYGEDMIVYPTHYLRANRKYESTDALVAQIELDKKKTLDIFRKEERAWH